MKTQCYLSVASLILVGSWSTQVFGQVECAAGGNLRGIRVDGELMAFSASIRAVVAAGADESQGGRGRGGGGQFSRDEGALIVSGSLTGGAGRGGGPGGGGRGRGGASVAGANYRAIYKDVAPGTVEAEIQITSTTNLPLEGVFFAIALPGGDYAGGSAQLLAPVSAAANPVSLAPASPPGTNVYVRASAKGVRVAATRRQIELNFPAPAEVVIRDVRARNGSDLEVSFPLSLGTLTNGQTVRAAFTIKAAGEIDKSPAKLVLDPSQPGRKYDGMGGNFRIQSPADAAQIQYNLENLRIAWGRVAMPLDRWQPNEDGDPVAAASGTLNGSVREAMEMAQKLARKNIPTIISIWSAPGWALAAGGSGRRGRARINPEKWEQVCKSIGSYLEYVKTNYDAEAVLFSFNESDMGINVLQSPQEHAEAIKRLGAYFASRRLKTRMLLGDTGNPTGDRFIDAALADAEAGKYIGAVSFHSWNSGTTEQYTYFSQAARKLDVPLLVAEGGLDPSAHQYRAIFLEPWFCLNEIAQYVEICRVAQPLSILHWQLTADYSILTGGNGGRPLQPAQRFWQIKQLGMTAPGSTALPITCDNPKVTSCAFADHGSCVVHLVNNGAERKATVSGLPPGVKEYRVLLTKNGVSPGMLPIGGRGGRRWLGRTEPGRHELHQPGGKSMSPVATVRRKKPMNKPRLAFSALMGFLFLSASLLPGAETAVRPVTPGASPEAVELLNFLYRISGKQTLSGQHNFPADKDKHTAAAAKVWGKIPAIFGKDWGFAREGDKDSAYVRNDIVEELKEHYRNGSLVVMCWHEVPPTANEPVTFMGRRGGGAATNLANLQTVQGQLTEAQYKDLLTPGTELHQHWCAQVDAIVPYLKKLEEARVPLLWRPFHEMNGTWFWWGGRRGEFGTAAMYKMMFDRLVKFHKIKNLIWVWNVDRPEGTSLKFEECWPGSEYVDVLSLDCYREFKQSYYDDLLKLANGKPVALGEVGGNLSLAALQAQPGWTWWMGWAGSGVRGDTTNRLAAIVNDPRSWSLSDPDYRKAIAPIRLASGLPAEPPAPPVP